MAGHSQFKNIMHRKGAQDAKRGKIEFRLRMWVSEDVMVDDEYYNKRRSESRNVWSGDDRFGYRS